MIKYRLIVKGKVLDFISSFPREAGKYYVSALKSEGNRIKNVMKKYVGSKGEGTWPEFKKITTALRERRGYLEIKRTIRYRVIRNRDDFFIWVGVIPVPQNAQPPSPQMIRYAQYFVSGRTFRVTREAQIAMAKRIREKYALAKPRTLRMYLKRIPSQGTHRIPPRPFVEPVMEREWDDIIRNIQILVHYRITTGQKLRR